MSAPPTPEHVEKWNRVWWDKHHPDKPFAAQLPLDANPHWPPTIEVEGKQVETIVGGFIYCPLPVSGIQLWGFTRKAERDQFVADTGAQPL